MERYYTVDEIAKMLSMHPKTIQRYIREGKLQAAKVGKGWRVHEQDLKSFMKCADISGDILPSEKNKAVVSAVADVDVMDSAEAFGIEKYLISLMNSKAREENRSSVHTQYLENEKKLRITLWGSVSFMQSAFEVLSVVIKNGEKGKE